MRKAKKDEANRLVEELLAVIKGFTAEDAENDEEEKKIRKGTREEYNRLTEQIIGAAIEVHRELGPGLLESAYEACLEFELRQRGLLVERQRKLPIVYKGIRIQCGYRLDLVVEQLIILELKAVERVERIHEAQLLSYLKLFGCCLGLLLNFNVEVMKQGIRRRVLNFPD
jgi:GxxExxY protein